MIRADKDLFINKLNRRFQDNGHVIVTRFTKLSVNESQALRLRVKQAGGAYSVIKNRLAKRAAVGTPVEKLSGHFSGPVGVATHDSDPVALAKAISEFSKDFPQVELIAGLVDAKDTIDAAGVKHLASLPGLDQLRATLLALLNTPGTQLVRLLNTPAQQMARVVDARRETLEE